MKKTYFLLGLSLLSMKGMADTKPVIFYGKPNQIVTAISPNGKWAAGTQSDGANPNIGFVWNLESNEITPLGMDTEVYAVSDNGIAVGLFPDPSASSNGAEVSAAGYWQDGSWHSLGGGNSAIPGYSTTGGQAFSISADGQYIGGMLYPTNGGDARPVIWKDGVLHSVVSDLCGQVQAISADGQLYGGWVYTSQYSDTRQPAMWRAGGGETVFPGSQINPQQTVTDFTTDGKYALWMGTVNGGESTIGLRDIEAGTDVSIPYATNTHQTVVMFDLTDSLSAVGYEMDEAYVYPIIYKDGKTQYLETFLIGKGVDFAADGVVAHRSDGSEDLQWNLMRCNAASKDEMVFGIQAGSVDKFEIPVIVKLNGNATNPEPVGVKASMLNGMKAVKVVWKEPLLNAAAVTGYNVYRNGEKVTPDPVGATAFYDYSIAAGETYSYTVEALYAGDVVSEQSVAASIVVPAFEPNAPRSLTARMKGVDDVRLSWMEPQRNLPTLQYYDDTDEMNGSGARYSSFEAAVRFDSTDMVQYSGYEITAVKFIPRKEIVAWTVNIYSGRELVYSQPVEQQLQYGHINTVKLTTPPAVPAKGDLYVAMQAHVSDVETTFDIIGMVYDKAIYGTTDLIRRIDPNNPDNSEEWFYSIEDLSESSGGTSSPTTLVIGAELTPADGQAAAELAGYNVYRDGTLLGEASTDSYVDEAVSDGDHSYAVEAVYADGTKSAQTTVDMAVAANYQAISEVAVNAGADPLQVVFSWNAPRDNDEANLQYCGNDCVGGPTGPEENRYGYQARVVYMPAKLVGYDGYTVRALRFFPLAEACDYTFTVTKDGETIVDELYVDGFSPNKWNTVELEEPFVIDDRSTYIVTLDCFDVYPSSQPALGIDGQPKFSGLSDVVSIDNGESFTTISELLRQETDGNWLMGMVINDGTDGAMDISGYDVRVDGTTVTEQPLTATTYTYAFPAGTSQTRPHRVNVDVIYPVKGKVEGSGVFFTLGEVTAIGDNVVSELKIVNDGPNYIRVEGEGVSGLEVYSLGGALVASSADNTVNVSGVQGGMYILKVKTAAGEKTCKVRVVR